MSRVSFVPGVSVDLGRYDTDKSAAALEIYAKECAHLLDRPLRILELGVKRGGSLLLWRDLLPDSQVAGVDIDPVELPDAGERVRVYQGFQQDAAMLNRVAAEVAPEGFDLIIDDASHFGSYTAQSFRHLFGPHLRPGGVYAIEDWGSGYWPDWPDGGRYRGSRSELAELNTGGPRAVGGATEPEAAAPGAAPAPSPVESMRRRLRRVARPLAARLEQRSPALRRGLERAYLRAEGAAMKRRFRSHDRGMVGFVKQLVDACAIDVIEGPAGGGRRRIRSLSVYSAHVFVHKLP